MKYFYFDFWKKFYCKNTFISAINDFGFLFAILFYFVETILNLIVCLLLFPFLPFYFLDKFILYKFFKNFTNK